MSEKSGSRADATKSGQDGALADEPSHPKILTSEVAFHGRVWDIRHETLDYNGHSLARDFVDHSGAVAILATNDANEVLLIQQYRHPIRMRDWEIPAGLLDVAGEPELAAAKRELEEEADLVAAEWIELGTFFTSPGGSNETIRIFQARGLSASTKVFDRTEEEADIVVRWVPLAEAVQGILEGRLRNSILALAVLAAHARG
jgi:8-oxo-dGTP pyrophosphatase MutT (NUDIX family)